jgi:hypothetical protein
VKLALLLFLAGVGGLVLILAAMGAYGIWWVFLKRWPPGQRR